jgi:hypothetical protein
MRVPRASRLAALLLLVLARSVAAAAIYECRDDAGHVAYQDHACAAGERQAAIAIAAPPASAARAGEPMRDVVRTRAKAAAAPRRSSRRSAARERAAVSYECRADDGAVFYRHGRCPRSIRSATAASNGRASRTAASRSAAVSAVPLPRAEACRRIAAAGSIGRAGREHDARVSTYERNAGRDPCRYD